MKRIEQPIAIVGILLSLAIAFWGNTMAEFLAQGPRKPMYSKVSREAAKLAQEELKRQQLVPTNSTTQGFWDFCNSKVASNTAVYNLKALLDKYALPELQGYLAWKDFRQDFGDIKTPDKLVVTNINAQVEQVRYHRFETKFFERVKLQVQAGTSIWFLTLFAGCLFMLDVACIFWWYARYIYQIQKHFGFGGYFLDFAVCGAFNLAAAKWTEPSVFLIASSCGTAVLVVQVFSASIDRLMPPPTDHLILRRTAQIIGYGAVVVVLLALLTHYVFSDWRQVADLKEVFDQYFFSILTAGLSGLGIAVTMLFHERIRISVERHNVQDRRFKPMKLTWPEAVREDGNSVEQIRDLTREGLREFTEVFEKGAREYDHLPSRVHTEGDLSVQNYILSISSWIPANGRAPSEVKQTEVRHKAMMVGLSHWLDDLVDGELHPVLLHAGNNQEELDSLLSTNEKLARHAFHKLFGAIIAKHTDREFFERVYAMIEKQTQTTSNVGFLFSSLNRVAIGSALFNPTYREPVRKVLLKAHNKFIQQEVQRVAGPDLDLKWKAEVHRFLIKLDERADDFGDYLLGLTTKTVLEMGMASEGALVNFPLAILYSILFAPLLYFHDVEHEIEVGEMISVTNFDLNYPEIVQLLEHARWLIEKAKDERADSRKLQIRMAFESFKLCLPEVARENLACIYK